jgi:phosphoglycolate phosphatase
VPSPFRLIVFDLDGTLVDSRRDLAEAANQLLAEHGCSPLEEAAVGRMVGDGAATLVARAFEAAGRRSPSGTLDRFLAIYNAGLLAHTREYPGIPKALETLRARATLAVLTNKPVKATRQILEGLELSRYFRGDLIFGGDGPFPRKPDPAGLRALAAAAATPLADVVLVGDSIVDWRTARAAETDICMARYGFGFEGFPEDVLAEGDLTVDRPAQLVGVL